HIVITVQQTVAPGAQQWHPPHPGYLKCNVDASFYDTTEATEMGWCLRDHRVRFIIVGTNLIQGKPNTMEGSNDT
ncbi:hypothetical protein A2U01_0099416, partial [Trifolium medium]|nr:hypothetical protein [Trifolium medium]